MNKTDVLVTILFLFAFVAFLWAIVSIGATGYIETDKLVPCLDAQHRQFHDEMCRDKEPCTNFKWTIGYVFDEIELCDANVLEDEE